MLTQLLPRTEIPALTTRAVFDVATLDRANRTIEVVWTTGARVRRGGLFTDPFYEELSLRAEHVRMEFLASGRAPVLDDHRRDGVRGVLGVVRKAWIVSETEARAQLQFSRRAELGPVIDDVADGVITGISGGYRVFKYADVTTQEDDLRVLRAVDWEPREISLTDIPFELGAHVRSAPQGAETNPVEIVMGKQTTDTAPVADSAQPPVDATRSEPRVQEPATPAPRTQNPPALDVEQVRSAERQRVSGIHELGRKFNQDAAWVTRHVDAGAPLDAVRTDLLGRLAAADDAPGITSHVRVGAEDIDKKRSAMLQALLHRSDPGVAANALDRVPGAADFRGMSLLRTIEYCEEMRGRSVRGLTPHELVKRGLHTTSDFPLLVENLAGKRLLQVYEEFQPTYGPVFRATTNPDFKPTKRLRLGDAPVLEAINEHGEVTRGTMSEAGEPIQVGEYGRIIGLTRKLIVNDDLGAFDRMVQAQGVRVRELEGNLAWGLFIDNAAMSDTVALFHADHGNLITNALAVAGLTAGRRAMRLQVGLDGSRINVAPSFLIVPPSLETTAEQLVNLGIMPATTANANPFRGQLTAIVEPRLEAISATVWFLAADPRRADTFEIAHLAGQVGPMFDRREGFDISGIEFRVLHDVGVAVVDHRGAVKSSGGG